MTEGMSSTGAAAARHSAAAGTQSAFFKALLERLAGEGAPGVIYEQLRDRLTLFFRLHQPAAAEELADETLDRLARRVHEGVSVENLRLYTLGIARFVLKEAQSRQAHAPLHLNEEALHTEYEDTNAEKEDVEALHAALSLCLQELGSDGADLILAYYGSGDGSERIQGRQQLANRLGLSLNALRNRALRLRSQLEQCTNRQLQRAGGSRDGIGLKDT